jgi:hypothetical protein
LQNPYARPGASTSPRYARSTQSAPFFKGASMLDLILLATALAGFALLGLYVGAAGRV